MRVVRSRRASVVDGIVALCVIAAIASPWTISIPPAHLAETFGFESPACWLTVIALVAALALDVPAAVIALAAAELLLIAWFAWAMWIVTTPRFASLGFPFVGTDLIGPGWYASAVGLLVAAGAVVKELKDRDIPLSWDLWILTTIPGYGLVRRATWARGLLWTILFSATLYLGSTDSPDPAVFADLGRTGNVPTPIPREPEWILLALAAVLWVLSIVATAWPRRGRFRVID
jgi:hypothetical protein